MDTKTTDEKLDCIELKTNALTGEVERCARKHTWVWAWRLGDWTAYVECNTCGAIEARPS